MVERSLSFRVRQIFTLALVVMLAFGTVTRAYADDYEGGDGGSHNIGGSYPNFGTVWYGPTSSGTTFRYGVVAFTKYDAAMYCLYSTTLDFDNLSPVKKQKLLAGSAFTTFANKFQVGKPETTSDWATDANIIMSWNSARNLYGETYCYSAIYTYDEKATAKRFVDSVLNDEGGSSGGESGGGGSGPGFSKPEIDGDKVVIPLHAWKPDASKEYYGAQLKVKDFNEFSAWCEEHDLDFIIFNSGKYTLVVGIEKGKYKWNDETYKLELTESGVDVWQPRISSTFDQDVNGKLCCYMPFNGGTAEYSELSVSMLNYYMLNGIYYRNITGGNVSGGGGSGGEGGGGDEPTEPPIEWPDPPEKPVTGGPDVPGPGDPTTPTPPDPVEPTPGNPWIPIPDDDIDITGDDFQDLLDALNEHCIHLQNSIQSNVSQLWDLQSDFLENQFGDLFDTLNDNFSWLGTDVIAASFTDLKDYLHQLFEWLADQMEFNVNVTNGEYDDTSLLYWLKQIWAKLPTGINTKPSDPVTNPSGWWDWLTQLLNNLAADLMALGQDSLAGVLETLNELRNKFPFSLPWDVAALLALLVGNPVCPEFDIPCYTVSLDGLQEVGTYHITLEPYGTAWEGVKWIETLAFAVYLITHTGGLMDMVIKTVRPR